MFICTSSPFFRSSLELLPTTTIMVHAKFALGVSGLPIYLTEPQNHSESTARV